jgi:hypothetical protein
MEPTENTAHKQEEIREQETTPEGVHPPCCGGHATKGSVVVQERPEEERTKMELGVLGV